MRLLAFFLMCGWTALALDPQSAVSQYSLRVWQTADGLPDNSIQTLRQTRDGYLWIGTFEGLVRFDGAKFTVFDTRTTPQLRNNSVVALCERKDGSLWVGTGGGGIVVFRDGAVRETYSRANGLAHDQIRSIYEDAQGTLWITAHGGGLVEYAGGRFRVYTAADGLPSESLRAVYRDRRGTLWVGSDEEGLAVLRGERFERVAIGNGQVRAFLEDRSGALWIGTRGGGLYRREGERWRVFTAADGLPGSAIRTLLEDRDGNVWVGTENGGLARWSGGRFAIISTREGLPHNFIRAVVEDIEGNLWAGTRGGLARLKDKKVTTWTTSDGLPSDNVRSLLQDSMGQVWVGTVAGLTKWKDGRFEAVPLSADSSRDTVRALLERRDGSIWIGSQTGLFRWRRGDRRALPVSAPQREVRALAEDDQGRLWMGLAEDGLFVDDVPLFRGEPVTALIAGGPGVMWAGTSRGLVRYRGAEAARFTTREGLAHDAVTSLLLEKDGTLWVGTRGGLSRMREGRVASFTRRDGLLSDNVRSLVDDGRGHLWVGSARGVSRVSKRELEDFASKRTAALRPMTFDTADGMRAAECNGDAQPAALRSRDGRVWFPTVHGVVAFDPPSIRDNVAPLRVVVERVLAGGPSRAGDLEIQYTAISLAAPERVRFRYRLHGFEKEWVDAGQRRSAFYTQVPPGDFRFEVVAYPHEGSWTAESASVQVQVEPRFYQTLWFFALCVLSAAAMVTLIYRLRLRSLRQSYEAVMSERARIGREIHDTLMQGVTGVALQLEAASLQLPDAPQEAKGRIGRALDQLDAALAEARQCILELRSPDPPEQLLDDAVRALAERMTADRGIEATVVVEGKPKRLAAAVQRNLLRVAREVITNAALHSRAPHLRITLRFLKNRVCFEAVDDGCGFDSRSVGGDHFGLRGMRERVSEIGGRLEFETAPGAGTAILVAVDLEEL